MLYCRKKLGPDQPVLRKSCATCRKAKTACSSEFPNCRRCVQKNLDCVYEVARRGGTVAQQLTSTESMSSSVFFSTLPRANNQIITSCAPTVSHRTPTSRTDFVFPNELSLSWESDPRFTEELQFPDTDGMLSLSGSLNDQSISNWVFSSPPPDITSDSKSFDSMFHTQYLILQPIYRCPRQNPSLSTPSLTTTRSPFIHTCLSTGSQIARTYLLQNIQSYATLFNTATIPPFIHNTSSSVSDSDCVKQYGNASSEPLTICQSIVQLYINRTEATSPCIWHMIKLERDRMMSTFSDSDEETVLAMLQAITVYILLRIFDTSAFSVAFDRDLVGAMTVRCPRHT